MKPGSVLVVGPIPPPIHGAARVTARVVHNLRAAGIPVVEINTSGTETGTGWRHHAIRIRLHALAAALIVTRRRKLSSVYLAGAGGLGLWYQLLVVLAARAAGVRTYFHHHSFAYLNTRARMLAMLTTAAGPATEHVALCEGMAAKLREVYPVVAATRVTSNAGLLPGADPADATRPGEDVLVLGHLGNLVTEKGLPLVLETLRRLRADGVRARLLLGGPTRTDDAAAMLAAAQAEFGGALDWLGPVPPDEVDDFYRRLDAFVFPSTYPHEAEPMVVLESARLGVPTVAFDVGCVGALVPDPDWLVPTGGDFADTAARLIGGLADPDERLRRRTLVQDHFAARRACALAAHALLVADLGGRANVEVTHVTG